MTSPYGVFKSNWKHNISIRAIKMLDIGYLFIISSIIGYIIARILAYLFTFDKESYDTNTMGKFKLSLEIIFEMALIGIIIYASRQIIQALPFPLDGFKGWGYPAGFSGFRHKMLREWQNPFPIAFFIILFQDSLRAKISYFTELNNF